MNNTVTVGKGQDSFVFDQTTAGQIGAVTINHFDPTKDVIVLSYQFATSLSVQDNSQGNSYEAAGCRAEPGRTV